MIDRYHLNNESNSYRAIGIMERDPNGEYVLYEDYKEEVDKLKEERAALLAEVNACRLLSKANIIAEIGSAEAAIRKARKATNQLFGLRFELEKP